MKTKDESYCGKGVIDLPNEYIPTDEENEMVEWLMSKIPFETRKAFLFPQLDMLVFIKAVGHDDVLLMNYLGDLNNRGENSQYLIKFARDTFKLGKYWDGCYGFYVNYKDIVKLRNNEQED